MTRIQGSQSRVWWAMRGSVEDLLCTTGQGWQGRVGGGGGGGPGRGAIAARRRSRRRRRRAGLAARCPPAGGGVQGSLGRRRRKATFPPKTPRSLAATVGRGAASTTAMTLQCAFESHAIHLADSMSPRKGGGRARGAGRESHSLADWRKSNPLKRTETRGGGT
jgi:hypothetical protein